MKKVQQVLAEPGVVERFLDAETAADLRLSFAGLWNMDVASSADGGAAVVSVARPSLVPCHFVVR